jgi:hypothetical protein
MDLPPPRPPRRADLSASLVAAPPSGARSPAADPLTPPPAELDGATRDLLSKAIARAVAESLGHVRISSVPPGPLETEPEPPRSSMRVAAAVGGKVGGKVGKWGTMAIGALAVVGQVIVWFGKPEYASPIAQALKLIASAIAAAAGGGPPTGDASP